MYFCGLLHVWHNNQIIHQILQPIRRLNNLKHIWRLTRAHSASPVLWFIRELCTRSSSIHKHVVTFTGHEKPPGLSFPGCQNCHWILKDVHKVFLWYLGCGVIWHWKQTGLFGKVTKYTRGSRSGSGCLNYKNVNQKVIDRVPLGST